MIATDLQKHYKESVIPEMKKRFGYRNDLAVPKIVKVVVNCGVGRLSLAPGFEEKIMPTIVKDISLITGQKPKFAAAKKSISGFKLRQGQTVGLAATLRGRRMYDFLSRLINAVLPRARDFRGISEKNFDGRGNLNLGIKEHIVFPEVVMENVKSIFGLQITVVANTKTRKEAIDFFRLMGFPIKK